MKSLREQREIEIIEAAIKVFGQYGYYGGKVEEIAKLAGIGKSTVYEYFSSKKEIFQQMLQHIFNTYIEDAKKATLKEDSSKDKFVALLNYHRNFMDLNADAIEQTFFQFKNISDEIRPYITQAHRSIFDFILAIVTEGIEAREIRANIDKEKITFIILGVIISSNIKRCSSRDKIYNNDDSARIIDVLFEGLGN